MTTETTPDNSTGDPTGNSAESWTRSRRFRIPVFFALVGCLSGSYYLWRTGDDSNADEKVQNDQLAGVSEQELEDLDAQRRKLIVGNWQCERKGLRELTVFPDGTAKMKVTLTDWKHKLMFGERMNFEIAWEITDGVLSFQTTGGEPAWAIKAVIQLYGESRQQPILEMSDEKMVLKDVEEGEPDHIYHRVGPLPTEGPGGRPQPEIGPAPAES